jgi:hypothetical protein
MPVAASPDQNHILQSLPVGERERLFPHLELVAMPLGQVLYESGDTLRHVYFPTDSIISLLYVLEDGTSAEIAVVGNEGSEFLCSWVARRRLIAQSSKVQGLPIV